MKENSLTLSVNVPETLTNGIIQKIKNVLKTYSSTPINYVFSDSCEKKELECLLDKLPFYELISNSFFIVVEPYYSVSKKIQEYVKTKGFVYFILNPETGLIKIGRSKNPTNRLSNLKVCCKNPELILKLFVTNNILAEKKLHNFFNNKNVYGEWFNIDAQDIATAKSFLITENLIAKNI